MEKKDITVQSSANMHAFRRRFPRRHFKKKIGILHSSRYLMVECCEIGEGGVLTQSPRELPDGSLLILNFFVKKGCFVSVLGEVVYKKQSQMASYGIKFINLSFEAKRAIRDYIADKSSEEALELLA